MVRLEGGVGEWESARKGVVRVDGTGVGRVLEGEEMVRGGGWDWERRGRRGMCGWAGREWGRGSRSGGKGGDWEGESRSGGRGGLAGKGMVRRDGGKWVQGV